jgi:L-alanine-DL-glutamate epimerase-like enolase superfamily enzyme
LTRIAEIRTHPLSVPLAETLYTAHECHQKAHLIVVEVRTDDGLVGTAEIHATPMPAVCDWVGRFAELLKGVPVLADLAASWRHVREGRPASSAGPLVARQRDGGHRRHRPGTVGHPRQGG